VLCCAVLCRAVLQTIAERQAAEAAEAAAEEEKQQRLTERQVGEKGGGTLLSRVLRLCVCMEGGGIPCGLAALC